MAAPTTAANASLYVGDLDPQVNETMLYDHFKQIGPVMSVRVCQDNSTRKSLGYGYVNFQNPADAAKALQELNFTKIRDRACRIMWTQRDPALRKSGVNNIIVKGIPAEIDHRALLEAFTNFGMILSCKVVYDEKGASRGYGYVQFSTDEAAAQAVAKMNGMMFNENKVTVERYRSRQQMQEEIMKKYTNLYIKNIQQGVDEAALREAFSVHGEIDSMCIMRGEDGLSKGFAFVSYKEHDSAVAAVEAFHNQPHPLCKEGLTLYVARAQSKRERLRNREAQWRERQSQYAKFPNLYIKNLDDNVTRDQLKEAFERYGPTISCKIAVDPNTGASRGFGFVSFREHAHAQKAIQEMSGVPLYGTRPLYVCYAQKRDARRQQLEELQRKRLRNAGGAFPPGMGGPGGMGQPPGAQGGFYPPNVPQGMYPQQGGFPQMFSGAMPGAPMGMPRPGMGGVMPGRPLAMQAPQAPQLIRRMPLPKPSVPMVAQPQRPAAGGAIDAQYLASLTPDQQKNILGERLYHHINKRFPEQSAKITGMLLEMDNAEILNLLDSPDLLDGKVQEAVEVLRQHSGM